MMASDLQAAMSNTSPGSKYAHLGFGNSLERARRTVARNTISKWEERKAQQKEDQVRLRRLKAEESMAARRREEELKHTGEELGQRLLDTLRSEVILRMESQYRDQVRDSTEKEQILWRDGFRREQRVKIMEELREDLEPVVKAQLTLEHIDNVKIELRNTLRSEVRTLLREECIDAVESEVRAELSSEMRSEVVNNLREEHFPDVVRTLREELREELLQQLRDDMASQFSEDRNHDASTLPVKSSAQSNDTHSGIVPPEGLQANGSTVNGITDGASDVVAEDDVEGNQTSFTDHDVNGRSLAEYPSKSEPSQYQSAPEISVEAGGGTSIAGDDSRDATQPVVSTNGFALIEEDISEQKFLYNLNTHSIVSKEKDHTFNKDVHSIKFSSPAPSNSSTRKRSLADLEDDSGNEQDYASAKRFRDGSHDAEKDPDHSRRRVKQEGLDEEMEETDGAREIERQVDSQAGLHGKPEERPEKRQSQENNGVSVEGRDVEGENGQGIPFAKAEEDLSEQEFEGEEDEEKEDEAEDEVDEDESERDGEYSEEDDGAEAISTSKDADGDDEHHGSLGSVSEQSDGFEGSEGEDHLTGDESLGENNDFATAHLRQSGEFMEGPDDLSDGNLGYETESDAEHSLHDGYGEAEDAAQRVISFTNTHETPIELDDSEDEGDA